MYVPAHWSEEELDLEHISLDLENYRIPPTQRISEDAMLAYMFKYKGIVALAKSIVRYRGLFPHEKIICLRNGNRSFTVLEGNRRIATLKFLVWPSKHLALDADRARLPNPGIELLDQLRKVPAVVVDTRAVADGAIAGTHIYGHKFQWSDRAKMQFASDRIREGIPLSEIASELAMDTMEVSGWNIRNKIFEFVVPLSQWSAEHRDMLWDENLKLEPFFQKVVNRKIVNHFGAPFFLKDGSPNPSVQHLDKYVYVIALDSLISQIDESVPRRLKPSDDLTAYLRQRFGKPVEATETHQPTITADLFTEPNIEDVGFSVVSHAEGHGLSEEGVEPLSRKSDYSFFRKLNCTRKDDERLCQLCRELRGLSAVSGSDGGLSLQKYRLAFTFLIRATLERCFYYHVIKLGMLKDFKSRSDKKRRFSIEDYLKYFSENGRALDLEIELEDKIKSIRADGDLINDLHWNIHNDYGPKSIERIREISDKVRPVVEYFSSVRGYDA